jgi:YegS/Rv2252/BmrU family lipid kinase
MDRLDVEYELIQTRRPGHAVEIARRAAGDGYEALAAVGGDGTVNEVANGLMRASNGGVTSVPLAVIPVGSGNDFAYMRLGDQLSIEEACRRLVAGGDRLEDVGTVTADGDGFCYFVNGLGVGFDAQINIEARRIKVLRGFPMYFWAAIRTIFLHYHPVPVKVICDDRRFEQPLLMVATSVGRRQGGGFLVTPAALVDDGLLDVCIAGHVSRPAIFPLIPRFMKGSHVTHPQCTLLKAHQITIDSPEGLAAHIDGEVYATSARRFQMRSVPARLWVRS